MKKYAEMSHEEKRQAISAALDDMRKKNRPSVEVDAYPYVRETYNDKVIVEDGGKLFEIPYTISADGAVTLGDAKPVKIDYVPLAELKDIEIFEAGTYRGKTYTDADLDTMIANFDALKDHIKPVAVIGHDEDQDLLTKSGLPSAGWMESVRKVGTKILATFKDVPKVIADLIHKGAYKRISSEIYNDYNGKGYALRRVAILGGDIPEVKTLQDIVALYDDKPQDTTWVTLSEAAPKSADAAPTPAAAPKEEPNMDVQELAEQVQNLTEMMTKMQEETKKKDERIAALEAEKQQAVDKMTETSRKTKTEDIKRFCKDRMQEGRLSPALWGLGIEQFMQKLDDNEVVRFGEGKKTSDLTELGFMKAFFLAIPKNSIVRFGEVGLTGPDPNANNTGKTAAVRLSEATRSLMAKDKNLKYSEAFITAQRENPDLAAEYAADTAVR